MIRPAILLLMCYALLFAPAAFAGDGFAAGFFEHGRLVPAPEANFDGVVDLENAENAAEALGERRGYVLLNLWSSWCPPCIWELPSLARLDSALTEEAGLDVVAVSVDLPGARDSLPGLWSRMETGELRLWYDETRELHDSLKPANLPATYLLDARGRAVYRFTGPAKWDSPQSRAYLETLIRSDKEGNRHGG